VNTVHLLWLLWLGWMEAHVILIVVGALAIACVLAIAAYLHATTDRPLTAEDQQTVDTIERMHAERPAELHHDRFVPPPLGAAVYVPEPCERHHHRKPKTPRRGGAPDLGPGAGFLSPGYNSHLPIGPHEAAKVDSPAPDKDHDDAPGKPGRGDLPPLQAAGRRLAAPAGRQVQPARLGELHPRPADDHDQREAGRVGDALRALGARLIKIPIRGDAQGRDGGCAPTEPRPAARADLTGSLSPRPPMQDPGPVAHAGPGHPDAGPAAGPATQTPATAPTGMGHGGGQPGPGSEPSGATGPAPRAALNGHEPMPPAERTVLPDTVTDALAGLRAAVEAIHAPTDYEYPTGTFSGVER
jgi:hypothetical protein